METNTNDQLIELSNDEMAEMIAERNGNQRFCKNRDECCQPYDSADDCFKSALEAMEWKDKRHKQEKQQLITKANNECAEMLWKIQRSLEEKGLGSCLFKEEFNAGFINFKNTMNKQ